MKKFILTVILIVLAVFIVKNTIGKLMPYLQDGTEQYSIDGYDSKKN
jgi:hypothetical protein